MYGSERHVLLRHYLAAGLSKTAIAARLGLDRSTIHRWIPPGITAGITSMSR
ncbi:MAG: helix-turn-helix domain-containing protein [Gemmatimonadales bacterium]|nr:helix-turn-helix domain-containing protein [Gemmatimonadales bacterium]